jgi:hypothetical protein
MLRIGDWGHGPDEQPPPTETFLGAEELARMPSAAGFEKSPRHSYVAVGEIRTS